MHSEKLITPKIGSSSSCSTKRAIKSGGSDGLEITDIFVMAAPTLAAIACIVLVVRQTTTVDQGCSCRQLRKPPQ